MSRVLSISVIVLMLVGSAALADWDPIDGHKMHYPQLPDPNGWDINITFDNMWDDWQCSETGPVDDIHFWASWKGDIGNEDPNQFLWIRAQIYTDVPADEPTNNLGYSHPGGIIWEQYFSNTEDPQGPLGPLPDFTMRWAGQGDQGWYDPQPDNDPTIIRPDHLNYWGL